MSKEGFIIKCKRCGKEDEYKDKDFYSKQFQEGEESKIILGISWGYEEGSIECACGNTIEF